MLAGFANNNNFRMSGGIVQLARTVSRAGKDGSILDQSGTDGHFATRCGAMRFSQSHTHWVSFLVHAVSLSRIYSQEHLIAGSEPC